MLISERKSVQHHQTTKLKKPRPPSKLTRYGAVKEFTRIYPESLARIKNEGFLSGSQVQHLSNKKIENIENEEHKFKKLRFPLLGPTREETCIFMKFQKKKGVKCEAVTKEKTSFIDSPLSSPSKTPCIPHRRKLPSLSTSNTDGKNSHNNKVKPGFEPSDGKHLLEIGKECTERLLFPKIKSEKTIIPSKYGYHPRSRSPTYKYLVQCRQKLEDLIDKKLNHHKLKKSTCTMCIADDCIMCNNHENCDSCNGHSDTIQLDLPFTEDLCDMQKISPRINVERNQELRTELNVGKDFLPKIVVPVAEIDQYDASSETDDDSVSMEDISKWENTLKEKMCKVQASGKSFNMKEDSNSSGISSKQISKESSLQDFSDQNKSKNSKGNITRKKKSKKKKKTSTKNLKEKEVKIESKTLNSNKLIYDKTKQHAVSKVASQHGLTEEEANDLYLTRDSRIVTQKYIDRLNQMAFGSDESDSEEYDEDGEV